MNLINKAVRDAQWKIPRAILKMAYLESDTYNLMGSFHRTTISLDEAIRETTILPRVVVDCSIVGGQTSDISLEGLAPVVVDDQHHAYFIPKERTGGRTILSALSVNYFRAFGVGRMDYGVTSIGLNRGPNEITSSTQKAFGSRSNIPLTGTSECKVLGHNVVMVRTKTSTPSAYSVRCLLAHDQDLSDVNILSSLQFSKLCSFAIKSYIYLELDTRLERGKIERGHELGRIRAIVDSYADAEENYETYLMEEWPGVQAFSDRALSEDLLLIQLNPGI